MWGNMYAWEKMRELEAGLATAHQRHAVTAGDAGGAAAAVGRRALAVVRRAAGILPHRRSLEAVLEGRGA